MKIKALFFDIDGTLVSFETHRVQESTTKALLQLQERGIKLFIATGRHISATTPVQFFPFDGYVTLNGGLCYIGNDVIFQRPMAQSDVHALLDLVNKEAMPCVLVEKEAMKMNFTDDETEEVFRLLDFPQPPICDLEPSRDKKIYQAIAFFKGDNERRIMAQLPNCEATRWHPLFSDVVPLGSNKWIGIEQVIAHYNIAPEETMAFGDGGNDIEMLEKVGIGVAMGNARQEVQQAADYVTTSVDDNGIANALRHFGLID